MSKQGSSNGSADLPADVSVPARRGTFGSVVRNRDELTDLILLGIGTAVTILVWLVFLHWTPSKYIPNHDALGQGAPQLLETIRTGGDWKSQLYRIQLLGGSPIHDVIGGWVVYDLGAWLGLSITATMNMFIFLLQILSSFMLVHAAFDLGILWSNGGIGRLKRLECIMYSVPLFMLAGFAPFLAYKLSYGHFIFIMGSFAFIAALALFAAAIAGRISITLILVALSALYQCFCFGGQQPLVYSIVFGAPILIGLMFSARPGDNPAWRAGFSAVLVTAMVVFAGLLLSMPQLSGIFMHAFSGEGARSIGGKSVVYSYIEATRKDWLSSIPWSFSMVPSGRDGSHHEINYALGPLLLLLLAIPWKKAWPLFLGMIASLAAAMLFSMHMQPVSDAILRLFPFLNSFRVPERSIIPFMLALPAVAPAIAMGYFGIGGRHGPRRWGEILSIALIALAAAIYFIPQPWMELLVWFLAGAVVLSKLTRLEWRPSGAAVLLVLSIAGLAAFKERLLPFSDIKTVVAKAQMRYAAATSLDPALASPLVRVKLECDYDLIGLNYTWLTGLSSMDGYWHPGYRYSRLYQLLRNEQYNPTETHFRAYRGTPEFQFLRQLYNIKTVAFQGAAADKPRFESPGETAGEAWFSKRVLPVDSWEALASNLRLHGDQLYEALHRVTWILKDDLRLAGATAKSQVQRRCDTATISGVQAGPGGQLVTLDIKNTDDVCPLTVSMNYSTLLEARGRILGREIPLVSFPANGALLGIMVPPGVDRITIEAAARTPWYAYASMALGLILSAGALLLIAGRPHWL
jgi:hypothetical protein